MFICDTKFEEQCSDISFILVSVLLLTFCGTVCTLCHHHFPCMHNAKAFISLNERRYFKKENAIIYCEKTFIGANDRLYSTQIDFIVNIMTFLYSDSYSVLLTLSSFVMVMLRCISDHKA